MLARRAEQRRQRSRRRRLFAGSAVTVAIATVVVIALASAGSGTRLAGQRSRTAERTRAGAIADGGHGGTAPSASDRPPGPVRNATPQPDWTTHTGPVPILEFHELGSAPADAPYPELFVTRPDFHHEMSWLDEHGYEAVTLETVESAWYGDGTLPAKPVVLSFDDGYRPQFTYALPELRRHGWPGVLNLKAEGSDLYESNVRAMIAAGWELAAHTINHLDLTTLDAAQLQEETAGARQILRRRYGVPVKDFCYPSGRFDAKAIAAVEAAGYASATTEIPGYANRDSPYELARFEVLGSGGTSALAADLRGG